MATGTLFRPNGINEYGDPAETLNLGTMGNVVIGGPSWKPVGNVLGNITDTTGLIGVPVSEPVQPRHGDYWICDGIKYNVRGPAQWTHANTLSGRNRRYSWWTVTATAN